MLIIHPIIFTGSPMKEVLAIQKYTVHAALASLSGRVYISRKISFPYVLTFTEIYFVIKSNIL